MCGAMLSRIYAWMLIFLLYPSVSVFGQDACTSESEPNDQLLQAATLEGTACFAGVLEPNTQDRFIWSILPGEVAHGWELSFSGGYRHSRVILQAVKPAEGAQPSSEGAELLRLDTVDGSYTGHTSEFLLNPGTYLVSILSDGSSPYRVNIAPTPIGMRETEPNDVAAQASVLLPDTAVSGMLQAEPDFHRFTIPETGARRQWSIEVNGPPGQWVSIELQKADGQTILASSGAIYHPIQLADLGLAAGDYLIKLSNNTGIVAPYSIKLIPGGPRVPSREDEPNDSFASARPLTLGKSIAGRLGRSGDTDVYVLDVGPALADKLISIALKSGPDRILCLKDANDAELQCRSGKSLELSKLTLPAGRYGVWVSPWSDDPDQVYALTARIVGAHRLDTESEPNEKPQYANSIAPERTIQGDLSGEDVDNFTLHVDGPAKLWTIKAAGGGVASISVTNFDQTVIGSGENIEGTTGAVANQVFLLPGDYWIKVSGKGGPYTLTTTSTGPPDLTSEREPNDTDAQAQRLDFGVVHKGQLSDSTDRDVYRFSLFAPDHIRLKVEPSAGDEIAVELEWGYPSPKRPRGSTSSSPYFYDALLDPGDYIVRLRSERRSSSPYKIEMTRADPFVLPSDLEPNDTPSQAHDLPASLAVEGNVVSNMDVDWFALPLLKQPTKMTVQVIGNVELSLVDGSEPFAGTWNASARIFDAELPAQQPLRLGVKGDGQYKFQVSFTDGPKPVAATPTLPLELKLKLDQAIVAAFWIRGQRIKGHIDLVNTGPSSLDLTLDVVSSHFAYQPVLNNRSVTLAAGAQTSVPFDVVVAPDAWANQRVDFVAKAVTADGSSTTDVTQLTADPAALPVAQEISFPLPKNLIGGFNVASSALGGVITLPEGDTSNEKPAFLQDGLAGDAKIGAFAVPGNQLPYVITASFGAAHPWTIVGITIHPQAEGRLYPAEQLKDFDLLLSEDGVLFKPVLSGQLSMLPVEQAFVLDKPFLARAAQLRLKSNHADNLGNVGLSEWKVIAKPGEPDGLSADIAEWSRGGHVVWNNVVIPSGPEGERAMLGTATSTVVKVPAGQRPEWVIGFNEDRAAQIARLEWDAGDASAELQAFNALQVSVSTDGPFGPWHDLGKWSLPIETGGTARWSLPKPVWARFVRFTAMPAIDKNMPWAYPKALRIFEKSTGAGYLSILGEWGQYNRNAIFEATSPIPPLPELVLTSDKGNRDKAQTLIVGKSASGEVRLNEVEDWYAVDVPTNTNRLTLTASAEPTIDVDMDLEAADASKVALVLLPSAPNSLSFEAAVEGGQRYFVRVHEPQRSVAIAYDTSASISNFAPIIRHAMAAFASGVVPGREFVNFMMFESPFVLKAWSDQPWVLEGAVLAKPGADQLDSSDLEATLTRILDAFTPRRGVRAAIIVTDAATPGFERASGVWAKLGSLRPRIFAAHIGGGSDPRREKQIMQDLAAVNGGYYASARTQAEMDVVSERAAAWLRRPTRYQLLASVYNAVPPESGTLQVVGRSPIETKPLQKQAVPPALPPDGAVELIFDASGSMLQRLNGERRIEIARRVLSDLVTKTLSPTQFMALRVFGDDHPDSCETRLASPLAPLDPKSMVKLIRKITPKNLARTPIAASLRAVRDDLAEAKGLRTIMLVTDGEETCDGDPETEIAGLRAKGFDVRVNIIGFAVDDSALKETFQKWAKIGGGTYFDVGNAAELAVAVRAAVQLPYRVLDQTGAEVASGIIGGPAVKLPPATYRLEVGTTNPLVIESVVVEAGQPTSISYAPQQ